MPAKPRTARLDRDNATRRISLYIRAKGYCERCGERGGPHDHAHAIRRRFSHTRTDERNGWCLCRPCHTEIDTNVTSFNELVRLTMGWELYRELEEKSRRRDRFDWATELDRVKSLA